eukprot:364821-Chlamydomonas_euryale.AAC.17
MRARPDRAAEATKELRWRAKVHASPMSRAAAPGRTESAHGIVIVLGRRNLLRPGCDRSSAEVRPTRARAPTIVIVPRPLPRRAPPAGRRTAGSGRAGAHPGRCAQCGQALCVPDAQSVR